MPCDDKLEDSVVRGCDTGLVDVTSVELGGAVDVVVVAAVDGAVGVLDCGGGFVLAAAPDETVMTLTSGHSAWTPMPAWNTPMILASGTSTSLQLLSTASAILAMPCAQALLQRFLFCPLLTKSSGVQPDMVLVYTSWHGLLGIRMRGVKLASETADVAAVAAKSAELNTTVLNAMRIVKCPVA